MAEKIIDNKMNLLGDDLKAEFKEGSKVRIAASCFTLFAFNELWDCRKRKERII